MHWEIAAFCAMKPSGYQNNYSLEYWQSQEGPCWALFKFAGAMIKFNKTRKFTVKVTSLKSMALSYWKGQDIRNKYVKYEHPVSYSKKVRANVQK